MIINKIVFLVSVGGFSGAENITLITGDELIHRGYNVIYCSPYGEIENYIKKNYTTVEYVGLNSFKISEIMKTMKNLHPDIIYAVDFKASMIASILGIQYISHLHNNPTWIRKRSIFTYALLYALNHSKANICVSDSVMQEFIFANRIKITTKTIMNVVDANKVLKLANDSGEYNYDIGFIGRIIDQKDPLRFVELICQINANFEYKSKGIMIGSDGGLLHKCEKKIRAYDLDIKCIGFQENPYKYLNKCKIVLMPSKWEGFGLTAVESMILGVPVLASPVGGLPTVIGLSENLCENDKEFVSRTIGLLKNENMYVQTSNLVKKQAEHFTNIKRYVDEIESMIGD